MCLCTDACSLSSPAGVITACLARLSVLGVLVLGALSGFGSITTAFQFFGRMAKSHWYVQTSSYPLLVRIQERLLTLRSLWSTGSRSRTRTSSLPNGRSLSLGRTCWPSERRSAVEAHQERYVSVPELSFIWHSSPVILTSFGSSPGCGAKLEISRVRRHARRRR